MSQPPELPGMPRRHYVASHSKMTAWLECPLRYRFGYLDRPAPPRRPARAHTNVGAAVHSALLEWWDAQPLQRTPQLGASLVDQAWIPLGFKDAHQSDQWRDRMRRAVARYLDGVDPLAEPVGRERTVSLKTREMVINGRIDRLDERAGQLVVVDYKTGRVAPTPDDARRSAQLALYAAGIWKMFGRRCLRVELHHVPTNTIVSHEHSPESLTRRVDEAESIVHDLRRADASYRDLGAESPQFAPRPGPLCSWCDFYDHCPSGQRMGPPKESWAGLGDAEHGPG